MRNQQKKQNNYKQQLRQIVHKLQKYQLFNHFEYDELITLAQNYEQKIFIYNEYLYQEQSQPQNIFLIEQGDFHYTKFLQDNQEAHNRLKLKEKNLRQKKLQKKNKREKSPIQFQQNSIYQKIKPKKLKQHKLGSISGNIPGQVIGQQQIISGLDKRKYNVKCASTNNKVIIIKKEHFLKILIHNPEAYKILTIQTKQKEKTTQNIFKNIQSTKKNLQNFVKLMNMSKQIQIQIQNNQQQLQNQSLRQGFTKQFKLPKILRKNQTQIGRKKTLSTLNSNINSSIIIKSTEKSNNQRDQQSLVYSPSEPTADTFLLTSLNEQLGSHEKKKKLLLSQPRRQKEKDYDDSIELKPTKSWNNKDAFLLNYKNDKPSLKSYNLLQHKPKYRGVIDSSALIKEKEHIISLRKDNYKQNYGKQQFQKKHLLLFKEGQKQILKQKSRQSSPAHSKEFMQKMLLKALKKAGYNEALSEVLSASDIQKKSNHPNRLTTKFLTSQESQRNDQMNQFDGDQKYSKKQRNFYKVKHKKYLFEPTPDVLQNNPFDECYFGKII